MLVKSKAGVSRTRRRMLLFSLPIVLLALFVAWKLLSMPMLAGRGIDAYDRGQFETSADTFDALMFLNLAEDWIPYFDRGTANAAGELYSQGTDDLAKALERAPEERRCDVRVNLALAWELQGDAYYAAGYFAGAQKLYETAMAVIDAGADEGCFERQPPPDQQDEQAEPQQPENSEQKLEEADRRVTEKLDDSEQQQEQQAQEGDPLAPEQDESGDGNKVDELEQKGEQAEQEKQNQDATKRGQESDSDYVEKPW